MNASSVAQSSQYLTFRLDGEIFALEIAKVREVLELRNLTRVPRTPDSLRGVINLRGSVVPVVDLRLKFGMEPTPTTIDTCIVIAEVELEGEAVVLGALADSVEEVFEMDPSEIEPAPRMGTHLDLDFIRGMGRRDEDFVIILDVDRIFSEEEIEAARDVGREGEEPRPRD